MPGYFCLGLTYGGHAKGKLQCVQQCSNSIIKINAKFLLILYMYVCMYVSDLL